MKTTAKISTFAVSLLLIACGKPSLEKYYVENQEKDNFVVVNIPAEMFFGNNQDFSAEQKKALEHIEKANILAFPLTDENRADFEREKAEVEKILENKQYKLLMQFGSTGNQVKMMYTGDPESIDEMIVYGSSDEAGFGVARILGDNMNPGQMIKLVKSMKDNGKSLGGIEGMDALKAAFEEGKKGR